MKVGLVGGGNMGLAYARSLVGKNIVESSELTIYESFPERLLFLKDLDIAVVKPEIDDEISELDVLILATKPQQFSDLAKLLQPLLTANTIITVSYTHLTLPTKRIV